MTVVCLDARRRADVRRAHWNGIDEIEVDDDQLKLCVRFLEHAPKDLVAANVVIRGGERIRDIRVIDVAIRHSTDVELDDCLEVAVDRPGDQSTYTLALVEVGEDGRSTHRPLRGFDPRYSTIDFSFKVGCPSDLDCLVPDDCVPATVAEPLLSYLAKDYETLRQLILDRLAVTMPDWRERHVPDLYLALVELLAYEGDRLSYFQDAVATEAYLETARRRVSVRRHARLVDYLMHEGCNARTWVVVQTDTDVSLDRGELCFVTGPAEPGKVLPAAALDGLVTAGALVFEPVAPGDEPLRFLAARSEIRLYTWGDRDCCLPAGSTRAVLVDVGKAGREAELQPVSPDDEGQLVEPVRALDVHAGDLLLLEEVMGPQTGVAEDADPSHRHVVRIVRVTRTVDPLYSLPAPESEQRMPLPLLEVEWDEEDALPFSLCLSSIGRPPECELLVDVSVARGNVLLVDHGQSVDDGLGTVEAEPPELRCGCGCDAEAVERAKPFAPVLAKAPLTFAQPVGAETPAVRLREQDPSLAVPQLQLVATAREPSPRDDPVWVPRRDLLESGPADQDVVVDVDDAGRGTLRFGDGKLGRMPTAGTSFHATYRIGSGAVGNVGAGAIATTVDRGGVLEGVQLTATNPLPAAGGVDPEPVDQVRQLAPHAYRAQRLRAVVPQDYADVAGRARGVQRAAAELRWTGSWYEVDVGVDSLGTTDAPGELLERVRGELYPYRRIGHDLRVVRARAVPLLVELDVCVDPDYLRAHVKAELLEVLGNRRLPDGRLGLFNPDALTFGQGVYVSVLEAAAQAVAGVESVVVTRLERLFEQAHGEVDAGVLPLGALEVPQLDNDPSLPEHGQLQLLLRGGR